jgi:pilus assembly protein Flp/PilA
MSPEILRLSPIHGKGRSMTRYINLWTGTALARLDELKQREEGQTLVEYALILALVSIVAIAALTSLGSAITDKLNSVVTAL